MESKITPAKTLGAKLALKDKVVLPKEETSAIDYDFEDDEDGADFCGGATGLEFKDDDDDDGISKKKKMGDGGVASVRCQADKCGVDLTDAKRYHRRHKVCEVHAKAAAVVVAGIRQRFCQQCSRFHELSEFDDAKRSCRRRLAGHNERRRKGVSEAHNGGERAAYRHFQIR